MPKHLYRPNIFGDKNSLVSISESLLNKDDKAMVINKDGSYFYRLVDYTGRFQVLEDEGVEIITPIGGSGLKKWMLIACEPIELGGEGLREDPPNTGINTFNIWLTTNIS